MIEGLDGEPLLLHPSVLPDAPTPLEPQLLFHRAAAHLSHALFLIEEEFYRIEDIPRIVPDEVGNVFLSYIAHGRYGGTEINNPEGPLGASDGSKARAYRAAFSEGELNGQVSALLRKSMRDYEKFLAHFDTLEGPLELEDEDDTHLRVHIAFTLLDTVQPAGFSQRTPDTGGKAAVTPTSLFAEIPVSYSTYHPLMLEAHFSLLLCLLILGDFTTLTDALFRSARTVAGLEGYPVFLPPRSVSQAKFMEVLERLAGGWRFGRIPDAVVRVEQPQSHSTVRRPYLERASTGSDDGLQAGSSSSSAGPSSSRPSAPPTSGRGSPASDDALDTPVPPSPDVSNGADRRARLAHLRALLTPLHVRDEDESMTSERRNAKLKFAVQGTSVDIILAWLAAVHLPDLEAAADPCA